VQRSVYYIYVQWGPSTALPTLNINIVIQDVSTREFIRPALADDFEFFNGPNQQIFFIDPLFSLICSMIMSVFSI